MSDEGAAAVGAASGAASGALWALITILIVLLVVGVLYFGGVFEKKKTIDINIEKPNTVLPVLRLSNGEIVKPVM